MNAKTAKTAKTAPAAADLALNTAPAADLAQLAADALAAIQANTLAARRAERQAATARRQVHACRCAAFLAGSGEETGCVSDTKRVFAPGHDAKLKGLLIRAGVAGELVTDAETGRTLPALEVAELFGFGDLVADGIRKAADRVTGKKKVATKAVPVAPVVAEAPAADPGDDLAEARTELPDADLAAIVAAEEDLFATMLAEAQAETANERRAQQAESDAAFAAADPAEAAKPAPKKRAPRRTRKMTEQPAS